MGSLARRARITLEASPTALDQSRGTDPSGLRPRQRRLCRARGGARPAALLPGATGELLASATVPRREPGAAPQGRASSYNGRENVTSLLGGEPRLRWCPGRQLRRRRGIGRPANHGGRAVGVRADHRIRSDGLLRPTSGGIREHPGSGEASSLPARHAVEGFAPCLPPRIRRLVSKDGSTFDVANTRPTPPSSSEGRALLQDGCAAALSVDHAQLPGAKGNVPRYVARGAGRWTGLCVLSIAGR
jgi:hypothetical protein